MSSFDDLLAANRTYSQTHQLEGFDGIAHAGVAIVTCMDSRIEPLAMLGLKLGDAKILRNPGGRVTEAVLVALVLGANLLKVDRVLIVEHTRCAVATHSEPELHERINGLTGQDSSWLHLGVVRDQHAQLTEDAHRVRTHPLIPDSVEVGGFIYDVDTGLLEQVV